MLNQKQLTPSGHALYTFVEDDFGCKQKVPGRVLGHPLSGVRQRKV